MNELELAERFNKELDGVFQEGKSVPFTPDPAAMELAAALARADRSGESAIKESLRARLVQLSTERGFVGGAALPGGLWPILRRLPRNAFARAALAAACLLLALFPILRRSVGTGKVSVPAPSAVSARRSERQAVVTTEAAHGTAVPAAVPARAGAAAAGPGVFHSIPMARPVGEPIQAFPIKSAGTGTPIILAKGREVRLENGTRMVLETEHAVLTFESRVISPEELFERKSL